MQRHLLSKCIMPLLVILLIIVEIFVPVLLYAEAEKASPSFARQEVNDEMHDVKQFVGIENNSQKRDDYKNALSEFTIEGINTTIPIHKTILEESNFVNGNISTDYIEKYNIIEMMKHKRNQEYKDKAHAAISGILLQSEFVKKSYSGQRIDRSQKSMDGGFF